MMNKALLQRTLNALLNLINSASLKDPQPWRDARQDATCVIKALTEVIAQPVQPADAMRLADAIDPLVRHAAPDHLTMGCAAKMLRALNIAQPVQPAFEIMRARTLLAHLWRKYDAGGISMGRSHEAVVLEAALSLLGDPDHKDMALLDADAGVFINDTRTYLSSKMRERLNGRGPSNEITNIAQPVQPAKSKNKLHWSDPTTFIVRFGDAMQALCAGQRPNDEMMAAWLDVDADDSRLQHFAYEHGPSWAQGIGIIDAAQLLADQPTEGVDHEYRAQPVQPAT